MLRVWLLSQHGASDLMPVQTAPSSTQSSRASFEPAQTVAHGVGTIVKSMSVILWGFSSLWFLPSELHQQVGHSVRQKKITTYFPFLDLSWLGIKSLARDTGPGDTQGSPAHTVAQSHLDPWHPEHHCPPPHCRGSFFFLSVPGWQEYLEAWGAHCQA